MNQGGVLNSNEGVNQQFRADGSEEYDAERPVHGALPSNNHHHVRRNNANASGLNRLADEDKSDTATSMNSSSGNEAGLFTIGSRTFKYSACLFLGGCVASTSFLTFAITAAISQQATLFNNRAGDLMDEIDFAWRDYEVAGLWVHEACRKRDTTRLEFTELYESLMFTGLDFQAISFNPNVTHDERNDLESEARAYYKAVYPDFFYPGFVGLEPDPHNPNGPPTVQPRSNQSFYFPAHYKEPFVGHEATVDFDDYSSPPCRRSIDAALTAWRPALTSRLQSDSDPGAYSVILHHPGNPSSKSTLSPRDVASVVVRIPNLIARAARHAADTIVVYIYDTTDPDAIPRFLGGATIVVGNGSRNLTEIPETELSVLLDEGGRMVVDTTTVFSNEWTVVVVALEGTFEPALELVILGGIIILASCIALAVWVNLSVQRSNKINRLKSTAREEKTALILQSAKKLAQAERDLNDFIAHEVRNPLAAAMSACTFVSASVHDETVSLMGADSRQAVKEDLVIIDSSLHFINDLLRNMLDVHRVASSQLKLEMSPTDLLRDVFEPVRSMVYHRGDNWAVELDCPNNLVITTDKLRLKQIILNLCRNSAKFVNHGFIRLRAEVVGGIVLVYVEDSGPGIPSEKRQHLFGKFQESLHVVSQGTGIGLSLCMSLAELMNGIIWLDDSYESGIEGCPGARFCINLNVVPSHFDETTLDTYAELPSSINVERNNDVTPNEDDGTELRVLPENLSMLFVDDDLVLRKLFTRSVKRVAPHWEIHEASSGESALSLVDSHEFDLIFIDQYMASVEKQLLGTETTRALRAKGVKSTICGLSANDVAQSFYEAGADSFMTKPFPCQKEELMRTLISVVFRDEHEHIPPRQTRFSARAG
jgi:signal transduction histidine kinase/CheY-like chemotaxis protein